MSQSMSQSELTKSVLTKRLYEYILCNDVQSVKSLIKQHYQHISLESFGFLCNLSPLQLACKHGYYDMVKLLLNNDCGVNRIKSFITPRPLELAIINDDINIVKLLIDYGVDLNYTNDHGQTPLFLQMSIRMYELLLQYRANPNVQDNKGNTPILKHMNTKYNAELLRLFFSYYANLNIQNNYKDSVVVSCLCDLNFDERDVSLLKSLHIKFNDIELLHNTIIKKIKYRVFDKLCGIVDLDINEQNKYGNTPLHIAVQQNEFEYVEILLRYGCNVNIYNNDGYTPIDFVYIMSLEYRRKNILKLLLQYGANVNDTLISIENKLWVKDIIKKQISELTNLLMSEVKVI